MDNLKLEALRMKEDGHIKNGLETDRVRVIDNRLCNNKDGKKVKKIKEKNRTKLDHVSLKAGLKGMERKGKGKRKKER